MSDARKMSQGGKMGLTKQEIIQETIDYYSKDPSRRAVIGGSSLGNSTCFYLTDDGRRCAVGRCIRKSDRQQAEDIGGNASGLNRTLVEAKGIEDGIEAFLWPRYQGHDIDFWIDVQSLHDDDEHWTDDGLSTLGEEYAADLLENWS